MLQKLNRGLWLFLAILMVLTTVPMALASASESNDAPGPSETAEYFDTELEMIRLAADSASIGVVRGIIRPSATDNGLFNVPVALVNMGTGERRNTTTNATGMYEFTDVPNGTYRIVASGTGRLARMSDAFTVNSDGHHVDISDFSLAPSVATTGQRLLMVRITGTPNQNPAGTEMVLGSRPLIAPDAEAADQFWHLFSTGEPSGFDTSGFGSIRASSPGFLPTTRHLPFADYINNFALVTIHLEAEALTPAGVIRGVIRPDATASGLAGAHVALVNMGTGERRNTQTNAAGIYEFTDVSNGSYRIVASGTGRLARMSDTFTVNNDGHNVHISDFALAPSVTTTGQRLLMVRITGTLNQNPAGTEMVLGSRPLIAPDAEATDQFWHLFSTGESSGFDTSGFGNIMASTPGFLPATRHLPFADYVNNFALTTIHLELSDTIANIFPDPGLAQAVAAELDALLVATVTVNTVVTQADLDNIRSLGARNRGIQNLGGMQFLTNLETLDLDTNRISDLQPLTELASLEVLYLNNNQISNLNLQPLAGLANLQVLWMRNSQISSIAPLAGLTELTWLMVGDNQISDIQPLVGLTNLQNLELRHNQISNIAPLAGLTDLVLLTLCFNQISDIRPLAGLTALEILWLESNQLISDIGPLAGLTELEELDLASNRISNVQPLAGLTYLESLRVEGNQISDLQPLAGLTKLTWLNVSRNQISDLRPLGGLNLQSLWVSTQQVTFPAHPLANPLVVEHAVFGLDGSRPAPSAISDAGTYTTPNISWTGLHTATTEVSYSFSQTITIGGRNFNFSGTVTQPLTAPVTIPAMGVSIAGDATHNLTINQTLQLTAAVAPANATDQTVAWTSGNAAVATVSANGQVTAVSAGTAVITVTSTDGGHTASVTVMVANELPVNRTPLQTLVTQKAERDRMDYTIATWQAAVEAHGNAEAVLANASATQAQVDTAYTALRNAKNALVPIASIAIPFTDVGQSAWYFNAVRFSYANNIVSGISATTFEPQVTLSRAMMVTILYNMEGRPAVTTDPIFYDVGAGMWYSDAIVWASLNGIVTGVGDNLFVPGRNITRQELAAIMHRFAAFKGFDVTVRQGPQWNDFADIDQISGWALDSLIWANYHGIVNGIPGPRIAPNGNATRAEAVMIIMNFISAFDG